jgi:nucleosome binding factor SPN SPT16 subunit
MIKKKKERNKNERERERERERELGKDFKEIASVIVEAGKIKICNYAVPNSVFLGLPVLFLVRPQPN